MKIGIYSPSQKLFGLGLHQYEGTICQYQLSSFFCLGIKGVLRFLRKIMTCFIKYLQSCLQNSPIYKRPVKQGPTRHRRHPFFSPRYLVLSRCLFYSTTIIDRGRNFCSCLFIEMVSEIPNVWRHNHGPSNNEGHGNETYQPLINISKLR